MFWAAAALNGVTLSPRLLSALAQLLGVAPTELRLCQASVRAKEGDRRPEAERQRRPAALGETVTACPRTHTHLLS